MLVLKIYVWLKSYQTSICPPGINAGAIDGAAIITAIQIVKPKFDVANSLIAELSNYLIVYSFPRSPTNWSSLFLNNTLKVVRLP